MSLVECEPAKRLAILVPAYRGWVSVETSRGLNGVELALYKEGILVDFHYLKKNPYLAHARNVLSTIFMQTPATDALWVDDDVGTMPQSFVKIAKARRPFIAGIYPMQTDDGVSLQWPMRLETNEVHFDDDGFIDNAKIVPTGFLRLNRSVFETLDYQEYRDGTLVDVWREYFRSGVRGGFLYGEDPDLCLRWKKAGGLIHVIPDITFTHTGDHVWTGNLAQFLAAPK